MIYDNEVLISVIVPVYNAENDLQRCVDSIRLQTIKNIQIILVDDCSTDSSLLICNEISKEDDRILVFSHECNRGVSAARNTGLSKAVGKYIYFSDADDYMDKNCLEFLINLIMQDKEFDLAICGYYINGVPVSDPHETPRKFLKSEAAAAVESMHQYKVKGYLWNKLFVRSIIEKNSLKFATDLFICEDALFCHQYIKNCRVAVYHCEPKYNYCVNKKSVTQGIVNSRRMTVFPAYEKIIEYCSSYNDSELNMCVYANYWSHYILLLKRIVLNYGTSQVDNGKWLCQHLKGHKLEILKNPHITLKRKLLFVVLKPIFCVRYRIFRIK